MALPAPYNELVSLTAFYPATLVPHFASQYGLNRNDLVMMEVDEAASSGLMQLG